MKTYAVAAVAHASTVTATAAATGQTVTTLDRDYHTGQARAEGKRPRFGMRTPRVGAAAWPRQATGTLLSAPSHLLGRVFALPPAFGLGNVTLLQALGFTGNGARHS